MSIRNLLLNAYQIHPEEKITIDNRNGFLSNGLFYFTTNIENVETIHMEQTVLAYYLYENGYHQVALPIKNKQEEWFTDFDGSRYILFQVSELQSARLSLGQSLAEFHQIGSAYQFEPKTISSYGHWKQLWIDKLTYFEEQIFRLMRDETNDDKNEIYLQILPYIIGMSENAIQYLRETETEEKRFLESDQGSITFLRFEDEFSREVIWTDKLVYDHPVRDIAEFIRKSFLNGNSDRIINEFLNEYQKIRPLSVFSWRLLYARLLFPIHLFDILEQSLNHSSNERSFEVLYDLLGRQNEYEARLTGFFEKMGIDKQAYELLEVDWL